MQVNKFINTQICVFNFKLRFWLNILVKFPIENEVRKTSAFAFDHFMYGEFFGVGNIKPKTNTNTDDLWSLFQERKKTNPDRVKKDLSQELCRQKFRGCLGGT